MKNLKIINMADVETKKVEFLWYPYIPYGKLTIIQGDPGEGKTTAVLQIAALLTKGEKLPEDDQEREPVNVIYQTAEDENLITNMLGFIKREIFDTLKEWLVEPIYDAIDEMMRGHYFKLNDSDKRILTGAIDRTVDRLVDRLDIGSKIEDNIRENMPSENQIEHEVQRVIRGRRR